MYRESRYNCKLQSIVASVFLQIQNFLFGNSVGFSLSNHGDEERGKFLTKLWCCVGGKYSKIIWFHQLG